jgi:hypothetical protein
MDKNIENKIIKCKNDYLEKYNPTKSKGFAIKQAINAAVSRNLIYSKNPQIEKNKLKETKYDFKKDWENKLKDIYKCSLKNKFNEKNYVDELNKMSIYMNKKYKNILNTDQGFKISHAQKSISIYLKHMWCIDNLKMPIQCPIDREILKILKKQKIIKIIPSWTKINTIEEHDKIINIIKKEKDKDKMNFKSISEWELIYYPLN